jgi:hypothetical protein
MSSGPNPSGREVDSLGNGTARSVAWLVRFFASVLVHMIPLAALPTGRTAISLAGGFAGRQAGMRESCQVALLPVESPYLSFIHTYHSRLRLVAWTHRSQFLTASTTHQLCPATRASPYPRLCPLNLRASPQSSGWSSFHPRACPSRPSQTRWQDHICRRKPFTATARRRQKC